MILSMRFLRLSVIILTALFLLGFIFAKPARVTFSTILFVPQVFPQIPVKPAEWFSKDPIVEEVEFLSDSAKQNRDVSTNSKKVRGQIFRPNDDKKHPALVLAMGVRTAEKDKPVMANFASALARIGFVTVFANLADLQELKVRIEEKETFISTFEYLEKHPSVDKNKISFVGISVGSSITLKAAEDEEIASKVKALVFFGGYFDVVDYLSSLITKTVVWKGGEYSWQPREHVVTHLKEVVISLVPEKEQTTLNQVLKEGKVLAADEFAKLSEKSQFAIKVFEVKNRDEFALLWQQAPTEVKQKFENISPRLEIENVKTRLFILHDRGDQNVSYFESRKLADALPVEVKRIHLEVSLFEHVKPKEGFSLPILWQLIKLYQFIWQTVFFIT